RFGTQPKHAGRDLTPGRCSAKAHDREHLGLGGRRVLVSRDWSGKTLPTHRADRAEIVRATLTEAGIDPDQHGTPGDETTPGGAARYTWEPVDPSRDDLPHHRVILAQLVSQRIRWRQQYEAAQTRE